MQITKPLQFQAYEHLKQMIKDGKFESDCIYSETKIAKELGFSRTPMRDAIQRLSQERYLDIIPSKGFQIHTLTEQDLIETYQVRCALEGFCTVQLAKDYETPEAKIVIRTLESLLEQQEEVINTSHSILQFTELDRQFHDKIVHYLDNSVISDTFDTYRHQMKKQTILSLAKEGRLEETLQEHRAIFENIKIGAVGRTYKATLAHLEKPKEIIHLDEESKKELDSLT
jgi:DNA-binding GntR family transcriptional regulator